MQLKDWLKIQPIINQEGVQNQCNKQWKRRAKSSRAFGQEGETFAQWAEGNGYAPTHVSRVLNGTIKASYGKSHEMAVKLSLKAAA